MENQVPYEKR